MSENNKSKVIHIHLPETEPFKTTLTAGPHELIADEPENVGGTNQGPDPYDYLLMSLGSCTAMTVKMYASRHDYPLKDLFVELKHHKQHEKDCENCESKESKLDTVEVELILNGELSEGQTDKLLEISKKCPVHRTLMSEISIESSIEKR